MLSSDQTTFAPGLAQTSIREEISPVTEIGTVASALGLRRSVPAAVVSVRDEYGFVAAPEQL